MTSSQPTQPLTDEELAEIREDYRGVDEYDSVPRLLAEVDRLRAELSETSSARDYLAGRVEHYIDAHERATQRWENADAEITAQAAKIKRLETERAALVRKLGLDWGPDEFGDLSTVHVQSIEITNCPDEFCPGWKDSGVCPNDYRHRY